MRSTDVHTIGVAELYGAAFNANPYEAIARLTEAGPIHRADLDNGMSAWLITGHAAVREALLEPRLSSSLRNPARAFRPNQPPEGGLGAVDDLPIMLYADPPDHTRLRKAITREFTTQRAQALRPRIQEIADGLVDEFPPGGPVDLLDDYAFPLPSAVICELLGVPHSDRRAFSGWFNTFVSPSRGTGYSEVSAALTAAREYFAQLISHHRADPGPDLLSALTNAAPEGRLTENELIAMALLLVVGGFETTATLIGNGALALLSNPDQWAALQADPSLVPAAVEEMLRHSGPAKVFPLRFASEELFIGGQRIRKGDRVFVLLSSANHDPAKYPDPDVFDIARDASGHLAFGYGIHRCVAAPLARIEAQIGIATLLRRLPDMRLAVPVSDLEWRPGLAVHGPVTLPVRFGAVER